MRPSLGKPVSALIGAEMNTFMTTTVEPMFSEAAWTDPTTGWSQASNQNMTSRISNSEVITSSTNANSDGMRYFALATVMTNALIGQGLGSDAMDAVSDRGDRLCGAGYYGSRHSSRASSVFRRSASRRRTTLSMRSPPSSTTRWSIFRASIPAEASTLVKSLQTQLETAYTIVSKIQQLSLVNYL